MFQYIFLDKMIINTKIDNILISFTASGISLYTVKTDLVYIRIIYHSREVMILSGIKVI